MKNEMAPPVDAERPIVDTEREQHKYLVELLKAKKGIIKEAYIGGRFQDEVETIYFIVLKEDTFENRDILYDILIDDYDLVFPDDVLFQVVPEELMPEIWFKQKIAI
jgi:hypothetical protein